MKKFADIRNDLYTRSRRSINVCLQNYLGKNSG